MLRMFIAQLMHAMRCAPSEVDWLTNQLVPKLKASTAKKSAPQRKAIKQMPLGAKGIATRSKDATRGSWPYYSMAPWGLQS